MLLDLPRGRVESIPGTNLQNQDQNTTRMLIFRILRDDERTGYDQYKFMQTAGNSAGVRGHSRLAEVFFYPDVSSYSS